MLPILEWLSKPGAKTDTYGTAPTQHVHGRLDNSKADTVEGSAEAGHVGAFVTKAKHRRLDRYLDATVRAAGSEVVFLLICAALVAWALMGIHFHDSVDWQVLISDVQAILCYIYDSLLMRQQLNMYDESLVAAAELRSRAQSTLRMLDKVQTMRTTKQLNLVENKRTGDASHGTETELPKEKRLGRLTTRLADTLGHVGFWAVYWAAIIVWLAFGPVNGFSNKWELDMNSATSALMVFVFAFLTNIRELDCAYINACLQAAFRVDATLERKLRTLTGDSIENDVVIIPAPKVNFLQRAIYYYADVIGTLVGIALLIAVVAAWVAIGPLLHFGSDWWLLIGTYAGLIGLHDSFVLRNVQAKFDQHDTAQFREVEKLDDRLFIAAGMPTLDQPEPRKPSLSQRISLTVSRICAHEMTVLWDLALIIGLIVGSSCMRWNLTGQLLSNVPPSIIETFLMIVLITGHNSSDAERRALMHGLYQRRLALLRLVDMLEPARVANVEANDLEMVLENRYVEVDAHIAQVAATNDSAE